MEQKKSWHNNKITVILLIVIFFPIGIYALWKNENASKFLKIGVTSFFILAIIFSYNSKPIPESFNLKEEKEDRLRNMAFESESKIQNNLKDPQSFELVDRYYSFLNDSIYEINITYSATNNFGGRIQNKYIKTGVLTFNKKDSTFINEIKFQNFKLN